MQHHNLTCCSAPEWCGALLLSWSRSANPGVHHTGTSRAGDRKSNIQWLSSSTATSQCHALFSDGLWPKSHLADQTEIPIVLCGGRQRKRDGIQSVRRPADYTHHSLVSRAICRTAEQWVKRFLLFVAAAAQTECELSRCQRTSVILEVKFCKEIIIFLRCWLQWSVVVIPCWLMMHTEVPVTSKVRLWPGPNKAEQNTIKCP